LTEVLTHPKVTWSAEQIYVDNNKSLTKIGPWTGEPDKVQWTDKETQLPCIIKRSPIAGMWCGYVGIPKEHSLYGLDSEEINHLSILNIHGDITFAAACQEGPPEATICHIPQEEKLDDVWWLGFDCAHSFDIIPNASGLLEILPDLSSYRDIDFAKDETTKLAKQLAALNKRAP
jgi:hypothetical protein